MSADDASSASGGRGRAESEDSADVVQHFWGVTVAPGKPYKMSMERTELHVTQVALAAKAVSKNPGAFAIVSASTEKIKEPVVLATLGGAGAGGSGARQALLDVSFFPTDEYATLHVHGDAPVCIAGSIAIYGGIIEVSEDEDEEEAAADGAESEEEADGEEAEGEDEEGDSDASDEDDGERAAAEAAAARKAAAAAAADAKKLSAVERMKRKREEGSAPSAAGAAEEAGARPAKQARTDKQQQPGGAASAAAGADAGAGKKQQQKQQQPEAKAKGGAGGKEAAAPAPAPGAAAASAGPQWKELANGLVKYMDLTPGMGPRPNKGRKVTVAYVGKLQNGKVFDRSDRFDFRIGVNEVIQGWDIGVAGMQVGGKRRLLIHSKLAYGSRGAPPDIPPNAALVFDVELLRTQ